HRQHAGGHRRGDHEGQQLDRGARRLHSIVTTDPRISGPNSRVEMSGTSSAGVRVIGPTMFLIFSSSVIDPGSTKMLDTARPRPPAGAFGGPGAFHHRSSSVPSQTGRA